GVCYKMNNPGIVCNWLLSRPAFIGGFMRYPDGVEVNAPLPARYDQLLAPEALQLLATLERAFRERRRELLQKREQRQARLDAGELPTFLPETRSIREGNWQVAPIPADLQRRWVEITGPTERKM